MKIVVTGANGQLGSVVYTELTKNGNAVVATDIQDDSAFNALNYKRCDITSINEVERLFSEFVPDAVIHCAAWTNVDAAEAEDNRKKVYRINVLGTENIALECKRIDSKLLYISTDYVFDGTGEEPWSPDNENYNPLNYYGVTKLEGEQKVKSILSKYFIVRTSWVFGKNGNNFVRTMLNLADTHDNLRVVNDQIGSPTYVDDLAELISIMILSERYGIYHATNSGEFISWYEFACEVFKRKGVKINVIPVSTEEYGQSIAKRPYNSRMSKRKLVENGFPLLPEWREAIDRYLANDMR